MKSTMRLRGRSRARAEVWRHPNREKMAETPYVEEMRANQADEENPDRGRISLSGQK